MREYTLYFIHTPTGILREFKITPAINFQDYNLAVDSIIKSIVKYRKHLPNSYNRHKSCRKYCSRVDKIIQIKLGCSELFISDFASSQYSFLIV